MSKLNLENIPKISDNIFDYSKEQAVCQPFYKKFFYKINCKNHSETPDLITFINNDTTHSIFFHFLQIAVLYLKCLKIQLNITADTQ